MLVITLYTLIYLNLVFIISRRNIYMEKFYNFLVDFIYSGLVFFVLLIICLVTLYSVSYECFFALVEHIKSKVIRNE